jgi:hypothetical protein
MWGVAGEADARPMIQSVCEVIQVFLGNSFLAPVFGQVLA